MAPDRKTPNPGSMVRTGFSILEILVVVFIISMMGTVMGVRFYQSLDATELRATGHRLLNMARYARLLAGQDHVPVRLHVNLDDGTYWLTVRQTDEVVDPAIDPAQASERRVHDSNSGSHRLSEKLRFSRAEVQGESAVTDGEITIDFGVDGSAQAALVQISSAEQTFTLLVFPWSARAQLQGQAVDTLPIDTVDLDKAGVMGPGRY